MRKHIILSALALVSLLAFTSCDDFLDITPTGKIIAKTYGEYRQLLTYDYDNFPTDRAKATLRGDELSLGSNFTSSDDYASYFDIWRWNDDAPASTTTSFGWRRYYHAIYISNYIIQHQSEITEGSANEINQLVGECYMMRALSHFTLVNLYAEPYTNCNPDATRGVPLMMEADVNEVPYSSSVGDVYRQILEDIDNAGNLMSVDNWEEGLNYRFSKVSTEALKARVMLYMGNWQGALDAAKKVVDAHPALENLNTSSVLPNNFKSVESILALEPNMPAEYATIGRPLRAFINMYASGDQRRTKYFRRVTTTSYTLLKGNDKELMCTFRSAEFYLTAAECAARLGDTRTAVDYLDALAENRYDAATRAAWIESVRAMSKEELVKEILDERTRELAFEGHRWFDLRRTDMPEITKTYDTDNYTLGKSDSRYTLRFPSEAVEANPNIEIWPH